MTELRECPFCGGKATGYPNSWAVKCESCNIQRYGLSYADAIERWNTRYEPTRTANTSTIMDFGGSVVATILECDNCSRQLIGDETYCPTCGARVVEVDE